MLKLKICQRCLLILLPLMVGFKAMSQDLSYCDSLRLKVQRDKDSLPRFDIFMKDRWYGWSFNATRDKNYSLGVGYYLYSTSSRYRKIPSPSFEVNMNYHADGLLYHNFCIKIPILIEPSLNFSTYTNFNQTSFFLRPGIGLDAWVANVNYYFNWMGTDQLGIKTKHNFSIYFRLGIIRNVWRDPNIHLSQWDRHKLQKGRKK